MRGKIAIAAAVGALALGGTAVAAGGPSGMFGPDREQELAADLAKQLDGVNANQVEDALARHEEQMKAAVESGERPDPESLVTTLASELDKSEEEVRAALEASHEAAMEQRQAEALQRLDEAVENGDLTEEQADEIRERIESGEGPGGPGGPGHHGPGGPGFGGPDGPPPPPDDTGGEQGSGEGASSTPSQSAPYAA